MGRVDEAARHRLDEGERIGGPVRRPPGFASRRHPPRKGAPCLPCPARLDERLSARTIDPLALYAELTEKLDEADTLMQLLPTSQWEDLVTRDHLDARLAAVDARIDKLDAKIDTRIERSTRTVIFWMIGALFASNGMKLAILSAMS